MSYLQHNECHCNHHRSARKQPALSRLDARTHSKEPEHAEVLFHAIAGEVINNSRHITHDRIPTESRYHKADAAHKESGSDAAVNMKPMHFAFVPIHKTDKKQNKYGKRKYRIQEAYHINNDCIYFL